MLLLIDATTAGNSGALTDFIGILPSLDSILGSDEAIVLSSPEIHRALKGKLKQIKLISIRVTEGRKRYLSLNTSIASLIREYRPDAVLFGLFAPITSVNAPYVLRLTQPSLVDPAYRPCMRFLSNTQYIALMARKFAFRYSLRKATSVICSTKAIADMLMSCAPRLSATTNVISSPFGPPWPANNEIRHVFQKNKKILTMHALPHKNIETILYAMPKPYLREWRLTITADLKKPNTRYEKFLSNEIHRLGIGDRVDAVGFIRDQNHLKKCLLEHDILVIPSRTETWSHTVLEAMAIGMPVIASDIPCHREVSNGGAWLVSLEDPLSIIDSIQMILEDSHERNRRIERGFQIVESLSWHSHAKDIFRALSDNTQ